MALDHDARLGELIAELGGDRARDLFRELLQRALQELIDTELTAAIGAGPHQRTETRSNRRNGARPRVLSTPAGDVELRIPKVRVGSFFPSLLEPRRRVDRALWAVIMTAYVTGTSTRKVDDLVRALGVDSGISRSTVSRICAEIDVEVEAFRSRALDHLAFPYVFLDATYLKARVDHRIVSRAVVVATGVAQDGNREVLDLEVGDSEDELFWAQFLRRLRDRGLGGVRLVISDSHAGLKRAIAKTLQGAGWQRCRVHLMRNLLAKVPRSQTEMVAATVRTIFAQPDVHSTRNQLRLVADALRDRYPAVAHLLDEAEMDVTAYATFPRAHWRKIWSTNPLERLHREIKRRCDVVGIFPDDQAVIRLVGAVLAEQHDEWQVTERRYLSEESMAAIDRTDQDDQEKEVNPSNQPQLPAA
ncbi:MAG: IS256 family transposase [Actinomycetota bacterium]|nr:IS256 family transposase [Actinomycetota bacterium]